MTLCSVASAEKCCHLILVWWCVLQKIQKWYHNLHLALGGTPSDLLRTRVQARDGCVFSRCSFESESEVRVLVSLLKVTSPKKNQMMTLLRGGYAAKCHALLKIKYQLWHFKLPFPSKRLCHTQCFLNFSSPCSNNFLTSAPSPCHGTFYFQVECELLAHGLTVFPGGKWYFKFGRLFCFPFLFYEETWNC